MSEQIFLKVKSQLEYVTEWMWALYDCYFQNYFFLLASGLSFSNLRSKQLIIMPPLPLTHQIWLTETCNIHRS